MNNFIGVGIFLAFAIFIAWKIMKKDDQMKKLYWYILGIAGLIVIGIYFGWEIAGLLGGAGALGEYERNKSKVKNKKKDAQNTANEYDELKDENDKKIDKAGDDVSEKKFDNSDDAADYIDDVLDDQR